jgi:eukaryotic-like serine/threonine-protein kinase
VLAGGAVALHQTRAALQERDRAEQVRAFVVSLLVDTDPFQAGERPQTVHDLLKRAQSRVATELASSPDLGVEMLITIGSSLRNRQQDADAARALDEAIALGEGALGANHDQTLRARVARLYLTRLIGPRDGLRADLDRLVADLERHGAVAGTRIDALRLQALLALEQGRPEDAMAPAASALALAQAEDESRIEAAAPLVAITHEFLGRPDEAIRAADLGLAAMTRDGASTLRHPAALHLRGIRARAQNLAGESTAAAAAMAQVVDDAVAHFGPTAREVGFHWRDLATLRLHAGDLPGAEAAARAAVALFERWAAPGTPFLPEAQAVLGLVLLQQGRQEAAIAVLEPAFRVLGEVQGQTRQRARGTGEALALALIRAGELDRSGALLDSLADVNAKPSRLHLRAQAELAQRRGDAAAAERHAAAAQAALPARASPGQRALWLPPR